MDLSHAIFGRFSCRDFSDRSVDRSTVAELLEAARWAPTGGNLQPWRFVVVAEPDLRRALARAAIGQGFVARAPVVIVVCALPEVSARLYGDRGRQLFCLQDTAAAIQNLLLAATARDLGACWVGAFQEAEVARTLDLPGQWRPVALVPVGWPAARSGQRSRRSLEEVVVWR
jgi:nitroreductase